MVAEEIGPGNEQSLSKIGNGNELSTYVKKIKLIKNDEERKKTCWMGGWFKAISRFVFNNQNGWV